MKFFVAFAALVAVIAAKSVNHIVASPALIEKPVEGISVGSPFVDFPVPVDVSPVVIGEIPPGASPLVQIIVNVANSEAFFPVPGPAPSPAIPDEVVVADLPVSEVGVTDLPAPPVSPVVIATPEVVPVAPVVVATPDIPSPVVAQPESLN